MTYEGKTRLLFVFILVVLALIALALIIGDDAKAEGIGCSIDGGENVVTFTTDIECDSAWCYFFKYPVVGLWDDVVRVYPIAGDSSSLYGTGLNLDSTGLYWVVTAYYPQGVGTLSLDTSYWLHTAYTWTAPPPSVSAAAAYVTGYLDVTSGEVTVGGALTPRSGAKFTLQLIGEVSLNDSAWAYFPRVQEKWVDTTTGRVTFRLVANTMLYPMGSYYMLSAQVFDGYSMQNSIMRKFVVDTLTDPVNLLRTTQVW